MYDEQNAIELSTSLSSRYRDPPMCSPGATYESLDTTLNQAYGVTLEPHDGFASYKPQLPPPRISFSKTLATATHTTTFHPPTSSPVGDMKSESQDVSLPPQLPPGNSFSQTPATAVSTNTFQPSAGSAGGGVKNPVYGVSGDCSDATDQYAYIEVEQGKD